jgi:predicted Zn finger-like uncharacterized protein
MFTRCPQCNTVFRISATQLRVAGGDVRCGNCAHVFNALGLLSDDLPDGEFVTAVGAGETDAADEQVLEQPDDARADNDLEFNAPEPTWSKYFIDTARKPGAPPAQTSEDSGDVPRDGELETITADPDEWRAFLDEMEESPAGDWDEDDMAPDALGREQQVYVVDEERTGDYRAQSAAETAAAEESPSAAPIAASSIDSTGETSGGMEDDDYLADDFPISGNSAPAASTAEVIEGHDESGEAALADAAPGGDLLAGDSLDSAELDWREEPDAPPARHGLWLAASLAMLALLLAQAIHLNRDSLAADDRFGPRLRNFYAGLDLELYPEWPLEAYRVRRAEALAGGSAPDSLDISAAVETTGRGTLGLPLVRVALRDQWANVLASRVFGPDQYLPEQLPEVVQAGTRIPVRLSVVDPGSEARGFVVDLCLPRRSGLDCQLNRDPFAP